MSEENVESFRRFIDAFNSRDVEAIAEVVDAGVEWRPAAPVALGGEATVYRGPPGISEGLRDLDESFDELQIEITEFQDVDDRVVGTGHVHTRGKESGAEFDSAFGAVIKFKNGKATQIRHYLDAGEALEAAGLSK